MLLGLVGGLVTGVSPCVLPVLPAVFLSGGVGNRVTDDGIHRAPADIRTAAPAAPAPAATAATAATTSRRRPYLIVAGLALSFAIFTLLGTLVLKALHIPTGVIRWAGLSILVLLGIGMIVPSVEELLQRPFRRFGQRPVKGDRGGFVLGLALGAVYVPCAGPVLAAITVAGATGRIGYRTVVLTLAFAVGTAIPLLAFALAGRGITQRIRTFRTRQRRVRTVAGVVLIALAVALTFNLTDVLQRAVPDYTNGVNTALQRDNALREALGTKQDSTLTSCAEKSASGLQNCGAAPGITGISSWGNTADDEPVTAAQLKGKVVLIDFWAYSCINCQRAIPHVEAWYERYRSLGLVVIGVHTPEYAFEHDRGNVLAGAKRLKITYPVALDNDYATWDAYSNNSWPAEYLIDASGVVRHATVGEGAYADTEAAIRQLLTAAHPGQVLSKPTDLPDTTPTQARTPETYLGSDRANSYVGDSPATGTSTLRFPATVPVNGWALAGGWTVGGEFLTAGADARLRLHFLAREVYLDVGGTGTITATVDGRTTTYQVSGAPNIYTVVTGDSSKQRILDVTLSPGLKAYSFTYG